MHAILSSAREIGRVTTCVARCLVSESFSCIQMLQVVVGGVKGGGGGPVQHARKTTPSILSLIEKTNSTKLALAIVPIRVRTHKGENPPKTVKHTASNISIESMQDGTLTSCCDERSRSRVGMLTGDTSTQDDHAGRGPEKVRQRGR